MGFIGEFILGISDVCGTGWFGTVVYYKSFKDINLLNYASYYVTDSTTGNGVFFDDTHVCLEEIPNYIALSF